MKFVKARWFHAGDNGTVNRIVLHDMEMPEKPDTAEACANYFAGTDKKASAHYCVDNNSAVQCVKESDIAFHAPPNTGSIGIEHAGYARQSTGEWLDEFGLAMLRDVSAPLVRDIAQRHNVPLRWLSVADLQAGKRGITSHNNVSKAFGKSTHTDPGPNFPVPEFMAWVTNTQEAPDMDAQQNQMLIDNHNRLENAEGALQALQAGVGDLKKVLAEIVGRLDTQQPANGGNAPASGKYTFEPNS